MGGNSILFGCTSSRTVLGDVPRMMVRLSLMCDSDISSSLIGPVFVVSKRERAASYRMYWSINESENEPKVSIRCNGWGEEVLLSSSCGVNKYGTKETVWFDDTGIQTVDLRFKVGERFLYEWFDVFGVDWVCTRLPICPNANNLSVGLANTGVYQKPALLSYWSKAPKHGPFYHRSIKPHTRLHFLARTRLPMLTRLVQRHNQCLARLSLAIPQHLRAHRPECTHTCSRTACPLIFTISPFPIPLNTIIHGWQAYTDPIHDHFSWLKGSKI